MSTLADLIERHIKQKLHHSEDQTVALSRAQLAELFECVPSQINYVLTTRFTLDQGYIIESRRGGGGYIRVARIGKANREQLVDELLHRVGESITEKQAEQFIGSFHELGVITSKQRQLLRAVLQKETENIDRGAGMIRASVLRGVVLMIIYK